MDLSTYLEIFLQLDLILFFILVCVSEKLPTDLYPFPPDGETFIRVHEVRAKHQRVHQLILLQAYLSLPYLSVRKYKKAAYHQIAVRLVFVFVFAIPSRNMKRMIRWMSEVSSRETKSSAKLRARMGLKPVVRCEKKQAEMVWTSSERESG